MKVFDITTVRFVFCSRLCFVNAVPAFADLCFVNRWVSGCAFELQSLRVCMGRMGESGESEPGNDFGFWSSVGG